MPNRYKIGERGHLTAKGTLTGKIRLRAFSLAPALVGICDGSEIIQEADTINTVAGPDTSSVSVEPYFFGGTRNVSDRWYDTSGPFLVGLRLRANAGFGATETVTDIYITLDSRPAGAGPPTLGGVDITISYTANYQFDFTPETDQDFTEGSFPTYGGASAPDTPPQGDLAIVERIKPGTKVSALIAAEVSFAVICTPSQSYPSSASGSALSDRTVNEDRGLDYTFLFRTKASAKEDTCTATSSLNWLGASHTNVSCNSSAGAASASASASGSSRTCIANASGACKQAWADASDSITPKRQYRLKGVVRRMEQPYPNAQLTVRAQAGVDVDITANAAGEFEYLGEQEEWSAVVTTYAADSSATPISDSDSRSDSRSEWGEVWVKLKADWLSAEGLESTLWRVLQRAYAPYNVFSLVQAAEKPLSSGYSGTGPADISRTLSLANGADADLDGLSFANFSLQGYAYVDVRLKKTGSNRAIGMKFSTKEWTKDKNGAAITVTNSFQTFRLDLLAPTNGTAETDDKDSKFPYATASPITVSDSEMWGVSNASAILLTGLDSETYTVEWVKLVRDAFSRVTALNGYSNFVLASVGDTSEYLVRLLDGFTDGRRSLEHIALIHNTVTDAYTHRTLDQVADSINGGPPDGDQPADGWVATKNSFVLTGCSPASPLLPALSPCWLNLARHAVWLEGAGAKYSSGMWAYGFHLDCASARQMQAQMLYDRLTYFPPGIGDALQLEGGSVSYDGGRFQIRAATTLRSLAGGVVLDSTPLRAAGIHVAVNGGTDGEASTEADGTYRTGIPYPPGGVTRAVMADVGTAPSVNIAFKTRVQKRACFRVVVSTVFRAIEADSPRAWLHLSDGKRILTDHTVSGLPAFESGEYANVDYWHRLRTDARRGVLYALGKEGSTTFRLYVSEDGGVTGVERLTMTASSAIIEVDSERGVVALWYSDGADSDKVYRTQSTDGGVTWSSPETVSYASALLYGLLLDGAHDPRMDGRLFIVITISGDTRVLRSDDLGQSFLLARS